MLANNFQWLKEMYKWGYLHLSKEIVSTCLDNWEKQSIQLTLNNIRINTDYIMDVIRILF
jgi:hypothetical protein